MAGLLIRRIIGGARWQDWLWASGGGAAGGLYAVLTSACADKTHSVTVCFAPEPAGGLGDPSSMMLSQLLALQVEMVRYELRQAMHAVSEAAASGLQPEREWARYEGSSAQRASRSLSLAVLAAVHG